MRRHWRNPVLAGAAGSARRYLAIYENNDHDLSRNGEAEVLRRLSTTLHEVVDVGAFEGSWTTAVRSVAPDARIHCVEPSPAIADSLVRRFSSDGRVSVPRCALGSEPATATLHVHRGHASLTSLVPSDSAMTDPWR